MGLVVGCLRFFYHQASPYFHRSVRVQPVAKKSDKDGFAAKAAGPGTPFKPLGPKDGIAILSQSWEAPAPSTPKESVWSVFERRALQPTRHLRKPRERAWRTVYCYVAATEADFATVSWTNAFGILFLTVSISHLCRSTGFWLQRYAKGYQFVFFLLFIYPSRLHFW